jgi:hypothetical protein
MDTTTTAVETKVETAATQQVVADQTTTEVDYEAILKQKDDELARVRTEKDNYRKGLLKAKGKLPDDYQSDTDDVEEDLNAKVSRLVQEQLLTTKEAQIQAEKDSLITNLARKNKELNLALKNRANVTSTSAQGSNEDKPEVKNDNFFSADQINSLKAKGWDDKKIELFKKNMKAGVPRG